MHSESTLRAGSSALECGWYTGVSCCGKLGTEAPLYARQYPCASIPPLQLEALEQLNVSGNDGRVDPEALLEAAEAAPSLHTLTSVGPPCGATLGRICRLPLLSPSPATCLSPAGSLPLHCSVSGVRLTSAAAFARMMAGRSGPGRRRLLRILPWDMPGFDAGDYV